MISNCQMLKSQTAERETIGLTNNDVNFDVTYKSHQNWLKTYFINNLKIFDDHHM